MLLQFTQKWLPKSTQKDEHNFRNPVLTLKEFDEFQKDIKYPTEHIPYIISPSFNDIVEYDRALSAKEKH